MYNYFPRDEGTPRFSVSVFFSFQSKSMHDLVSAVQRLCFSWQCPPDGRNTACCPVFEAFVFFYSFLAVSYQGHTVHASYFLPHCNWDNASAWFDDKAPNVVFSIYSRWAPFPENTNFSFRLFSELTGNSTSLR